MKVEWWALKAMVFSPGKKEKKTQKKAIILLIKKKFISSYILHVPILLAWMLAIAQSNPKVTGISSRSPKLKCPEYSVARSLNIILFQYRLIIFSTSFCSKFLNSAGRESCVKYASCIAFLKFILREVRYQTLCEVSDFAANMLKVADF